MPEVLFRLDPTRRFTEQEKIGHNRWHPDIPPVATVRPGQSFRVHCREWFDGWMRNDDSAEDIRDAPLTRVHCLSGPFAVEGAQPGDLLMVDILDVGPMEEDSGPLAGQGWGYTGIFHKRNGGGFLTDEFPDAYKAVWDFKGQTATSRHIPGVKFTGMVHSGLMGTAPSHDLLARWNEREATLIATDPHRVPPLALPPEPRDAILGTLSGEDFERVAREAARTAPPRENGGNQDIKNLTKGTRAFYPVYVPGAKFSVGDLHFSQGDGEITFCGAIEMGGYIDFHMDLIKDGMNKYGVSENTIFLPGITDPRYCQWLAFSGISVTKEGEQRYLDSDVAYKRACLHAISYLTKFGYSGEQIYLLLGAAPIEGRFSGVVDIPNCCATIYIPTEIFDFDVRPNTAGTTRVDPGRGAPRAGFE
ncbi:acetamidase/formamidase family protein [Planosporangium flavigriseum]|uniref:formamidase n=1 Tax=Planosporangium flavigriseum TaxID=373681 RepID=UPI001438D736|nr:formamidase [Planosporangium flavigriseum]NJC65885.1 acetamidase/formamidase family protein [Planosporangium flavigriseum]